MTAAYAVRGLSLVVSLIVATAVVVRTQNAVFSSRVDAVRVDVLVTDNGQPVRGLGPNDFEVRDNGVVQRIDLISFDQVPLNVILAFDMSDSVAGDRLARLRAAGGATLASLAPDDQAALVTFSHVVGLAAGLTKNLGAIRTALDHASEAGNTAVIDGTYAAITIGESDAGRALVIVFSDGLDTSSWLSANTVLDAARRSDVVAYAVVVRSPVKPEFLRDVTSLSGGRLYEVERSEDLQSTFVGIVNEFRRRYLVSYTPLGVAREGWHRLDVRVKRKAVIKARPGYLAGP
jgi:VWFA-related protein